VTGAVPIVTTDHGGDGPDVLLLHGGGRTRHDWDRFAPLLRDRGYHPVAMDLRGHGDSAPGRWSWPSVLADVAAVAGTLDRPALVGHSLGGMVAALWAREHPECPLAVNIDGHGNPTRPDQYLGLDETARAHAYLDMAAFFTQATEALDGPLVQMMREVDALDLIAVYRAARCPLLVVNGDDHAWVPGLLPEHLVPAWEAYRAWTRAQLAAVAREVPYVRVASLPTGHNAHVDDPGALIDLVLGTEGLARTSKRA
jgi:pimeloyl-ACP methyl ester carboxylesterase